MAWISATAPEATLRNGDEANELADAAVGLTKGKEPAILDTLAASLAERGLLASRHRRPAGHQFGRPPRSREVGGGTSASGSAITKPAPPTISPAQGLRFHQETPPRRSDVSPKGGPSADAAKGAIAGRGPLLMFLNEPPPSRGEILFVLFGFPVRVHPFFWLVTLFLGYQSRDLRTLLACVAAIFVAILVHELGHAAVMRAYGLRPAITLHGLGGVTSDRGSGQFLPRLYAFEQILISAAGPAAGFLLAAAVCGVLAAFGRPVSLALGMPYGIRMDFEPFANNPLLTDFVQFLLFVSVIWGLVNLLPVYPLDGGQIAREAFLAINPRGGVRQSLLVSLWTAAAMAVLGLTRHDWYVAALFGVLGLSEPHDVEVLQRPRPLAVKWRCKVFENRYNYKEFPVQPVAGTGCWKGLKMNLYGRRRDDGEEDSKEGGEEGREEGPGEEGGQKGDEEGLLLQVIGGRRAARACAEAARQRSTPTWPRRRGHVRWPPPQELGGRPMHSLMRRLISRLLLLAAAIAAAAPSRGGEPAAGVPGSSPLPTMGGLQSWGDELFFHQWRIQRNAVSDQCRLVDGNNLQHASGSYEHCLDALNKIKRRQKLPPMKGKAVVLLHGLVCSRAKMEPLAKHLHDRGGYAVFNVSYASTQRDVAAHAKALKHVLDHLDGIEEINFVAHSLGNIIIRHYLADQTDPAAGRRPDRRIKRFVMLGPPNHGSTMAQAAALTGVLEVVAGSPGMELGRDWPQLEEKLATPDCPFAVIAGGKGDGHGLNPLLPGDNDGVISVETTRLAGAADFAVVPVFHHFLPDDAKVQEYTLRFLRLGYFISPRRRQPIPAAEAAGRR